MRSHYKCGVWKLVRIVILEDNEITVLGLTAALESCNCVKIVEGYTGIDELLSNLSRLNPEVILLGGSGTAESNSQNCRAIVNSFPGIRVLPLNDEWNDDELHEIILSGASGFLSKHAGKDDVVRSIAIVAQGGLSFDGDTLVRLLARLPQPLDNEQSERLNALTSRERTVLNLIAQGRRNKEIGQSLNISVSTVRNCISQLKSKLYVDSRVELMSKGIQFDVLNEHRVF